ncbi:MAG TPA: hypothetical protein GX520_08925, partial [Syntrophaceticus sp.]|nr:hypothetical protein [Syntrophaceticus sp.]
MSDRRVFVDYIARTEGDGAIDIIIGPNGEIKKARWEVWEPPRFFESFMIGRKYDEVPEIVQRICGICPHAHHLIIFADDHEGLKEPWGFPYFPAGLFDLTVGAND